jgi:phospholipid N-methyltransferase
MKYISSIFSTGAVRKTPDKIINKIVSTISIKDLSILEIGAGKGEVTKELIEKKILPANKLFSYYAFELDIDFANQLRKSIPSINVLNKDAFSFKESIPAAFKADYIISTMPLSFYPKRKVDKLLKDFNDLLKPDGKIIILFHAFWLTPLLRKNFISSQLTVFSTLPLYFLLVANKKTKS